MQPDLEVIQIRRDESFKAWAHGYPFRTVRWHFHPEYELHQVVATRGTYFVGEFIGAFKPGNLVLTGPNLPHNWVSDVAPGDVVPLRCRVVQFSQEFIQNLLACLPELSAFNAVLAKSTRGALFSDATSKRVAPRLEELIAAQGPRRIECFMAVLDSLSHDKDVRTLASSDYVPDPSGYMTASMNKVLAYIREHLTEQFSERELSAITGQSPSAFSRAFKKHTGLSFIQYVNRLKINVACQLLMDKEVRSVTHVCYEAGFNNVSNFNRQFLAHKGMPPSRFRSLHVQNLFPVSVQ